MTARTESFLPELKDQIFECLFNGNLHPVAILYLSSRALIANSLFCWRLGVSGGKPLNEFLIEDFPFGNNDKFLDYLDNLNQCPEFQEELCLQVELDDDFSPAVLLKLLPLKAEDRCVGVIMSVSERQPMLEQSMKLDNLTQMVAHDLMEPLRTISNYAQLLHRNCLLLLDDSGRNYLHNLMTGVKHMDKLLFDVITYSNHKVFENHILTFSPTEMIEEIVEQLCTRKGNFEINVTCKNLPEQITTSYENFRIIMYHLIDNAIKFSSGRPDKRIIIGSEESADAWKFTVMDNGIGVPIEDQKRIFKLFKRLHGRGEFIGNGLGLAICRRIIHQQKGKIWLSSEPGIGSVFHFTIRKHLD